MKPVTKSFVQAIMFDEWPSIAAICDFGLSSDEHYEAIYYPLRRGEISAEQLDNVLGNGPAITELVNKTRSNPHKGIVFKTPYDDMLNDDDDDDEI